jgi:Lar family restriction alleviation protein
MSEKEELLPCPFCGCEGQDLDATFGRGKGHVASGCYGCGCSGPDAPTEAEAVAKWNTRAQPTE